MKKLENILFPTDFSANAEKALPYAVDLVNRCGGVLILLHVYNRNGIDYRTLFNLDKTSGEPEIRMEITNELNSIAYQSSLESGRIIIAQEDGDSLKGILKKSLQAQIDLIVMGTKGSNSNRGLFAGSITKKLIESSYCPVLAIPEEAEFSEISTIVYACNLQNDEGRELDNLVQFAQLHDATLVILHVDVSAADSRKSVAAMKQLIAKTSYGKIAYTEVIAKNPIQGINEYVEKKKPDLILMAPQKRNLIERIFGASITEKQVMLSNIPILVMNRKKLDKLVFG